MKKILIILCLFYNFAFSNSLGLSETDIIILKKIKSLTDLGINVVERIPLKVGLNIFNKAYLETKQKRMSHLYDNSDF